MNNWNGCEKQMHAWKPRGPARAIEIRLFGDKTTSPAGRGHWRLAQEWAPALGGCFMAALLFSGLLGPVFPALRTDAYRGVHPLEWSSQAMAAFDTCHWHSEQNGLPKTILQWTINGVSSSSKGLLGRFETNSMMP